MEAGSERSDILESHLHFSIHRGYLLVRLIDYLNVCSFVIDGRNSEVRGLNLLKLGHFD